MSTVTYSVPSIHCMHCVHTIQAELYELEGVKSVKVDAATKKVEIAFEPPVDEAAIQTLMKEINYPVVV